MSVGIEMHRWYAVIKEDGKVKGVVGSSPEGELVLFDSMEEVENEAGD